MTYPLYETMTVELWRRTIAHDHANPSRAVAAREMHRFLDRDKILDLTELGFCSAWDFQCYFRTWHDGGLINYRGYDTCKQFAGYAKAEWPDYEFRHGSTDAIYPCDITYARHVAMTMDPVLWPLVLEDMLHKSRVACVVTYHYPPRYEDHYYKHHQEGERDVWTNRYDRGEMEAIYEEAGFDIEIVPSGSEAVYVARRRA